MTRIGAEDSHDSDGAVTAHRSVVHHEHQDVARLRRHPLPEPLRIPLLVLLPWQTAAAQAPGQV